MEKNRTMHWRSLLGRLGPLLALVLVFSFFAVTDALQPNGGQFTSLRNLQAMLVSSAPVVTAALGMTIIRAESIFPSERQSP
jgi:ribose/xylose/arabinose/galactoside ABC-type transport system permease subunit